jgi:hypothetical protein
MGAAFLPSMSDMVDVSKMPPADVIAKHLGPIVMSQSYRGDGYVAESFGPLPLYPTVVGAVTTGIAASTLYRQHTQGGTIPNILPVFPSASPLPAATPDDSP